MNILSLGVVVVAEQVSLSEYKALARGRKLIVVRTNAAVSSGGWRKDAADAGNEDDEVSQAKMERERLMTFISRNQVTAPILRFRLCVCLPSMKVSLFLFARSFCFNFKLKWWISPCNHCPTGWTRVHVHQKKKTGPNRNHDHNHVITQLWNYVRVANRIMYSSPFWADANHILGCKSFLGGN